MFSIISQHDQELDKISVLVSCLALVLIKGLLAILIFIIKCLAKSTYNNHALSMKNR